MKGKEEKRKKKINNKRERGITLIALVITIIVLLILAGVSIAMLTGQNGILTQANNAKIEQSHGAVREAMSLAYNEWKIEINTGSTTKLASTETVTIQGEEEKTKAPTTISFFDFLKTTKGYIDDSGKIDVEKLTGSKQALGNGETTDIYTITEQSGVYAVYYNGEEGETSLQIWSTGDIVDWGSILEDANSNPEKYKHPEQKVSEEIGIGTDGEPVNMDKWDFRYNYDSNGYEPNVEVDYGDVNGNQYSGEIIDGRIEGFIPKYIYNEENGEFLLVKSIDYLFYNCQELTYSPEIPDSVTSMGETFSGCTSLAQAPTIPDGVKDMSKTFSGCTSLTQAPEIPDSVTIMMGTFSGCTSLTQAPEIPDSVTNMISTFSGCTSLAQAPTIPDGVKDMSETFSGCTSLTQAPTIPDGVENMNVTFSGCTSLAQAPEIPDSVTNMSSTFSGCTSLAQAPTIPSSVINMARLFYGCKNLTGSLVIDAKLLDGLPDREDMFYANCLSNASTNEGCHLVLSGSCPQLQEIYETANGNPNVVLEQ